MDDRIHGRRTPQIEARGKAKERWSGLQDQRGELVDMREA